MSAVDVKFSDGYLHFDAQQLSSLGSSLSEEYRSAEPFPHIVIEEFLPETLLRKIYASFPDRTGMRYFDRDQERLKYQYSPQMIESAAARNLLAELNGPEFLVFLQELTGIKALIPDPYFIGGGLHETLRGGHLSIHADFNVHKQMRLERRLNLLIYLNEDWEEQFGGNLELWKRDMSGCAVKVAPVLGRAVVFSTDQDSFHGHPEPLSCPPDRSRRSIATYYYTAFRDGYADKRERNTDFRPRPGTREKKDWQTTRRHFISDWIPPRLQGKARRIARC